jgi:transposase
VSHRNVRTTFRGRLLIVERHRAGWPQAHIAAAMGISRKCVKTWLHRFAAEGETGLRDRSSRPHTMPTRTSAEIEQQIIELRRAQRRGPDWIGAELGVPARTVSRVLARHRVPRLAALDPISGEVIKASKATAVRYERSRPGELVHMDVKKIGRIPDGGGWRAHGRASGSITRDRSTRVGFDYVHSLVDDHSRLAYAEILPDEKGPLCQPGLRHSPPDN